MELEPSKKFYLIPMTPLETPIPLTGFLWTKLSLLKHLLQRKIILMLPLHELTATKRRKPLLFNRARRIFHVMLLFGFEMRLARRVLVSTRYIVALTTYIVVIEPLIERSLTYFRLSQTMSPDSRA